MERKKDILLDVDEVICFSGFLEAVNAFLGTDYNIDEFDTYYIDEVAIPKERFAEFNAFLNKRNRYENPSILPNAIDTIKELNEFYNVYICSSCINPFDKEGSGKLFIDKFHFLINTFPFLNPDHFIFTGAKHLFKADIQIDDRLQNLDNDIPTRILFPSYHNRNIPDSELASQGVLRAGYDWRTGWDEVRKILLAEKEYHKDEKGYCLQKKM